MPLTQSTEQKETKSVIIQLIITPVEEGSAIVLDTSKPFFVSEGEGYKIEVPKEEVNFKFFFEEKDDVQFGINQNMKMIHYDPNSWLKPMSKEEWENRINDFLTSYNDNWNLYNVHRSRLPSQFRSIFNKSMYNVYDSNIRQDFIEQVESHWMKKDKMTPEKSAQAARDATRAYVLRGWARAATFAI